jgi:broad specificity phosphatase PhoE
MDSSYAAIYLCRHCKTAWNVEGRLQGTIDLPLAEVGIKSLLKNNLYKTRESRLCLFSAELWSSPRYRDYSI